MDVISDTNIFLAVALDEPEKEKIIQLTLDINAVSPNILPYEIGNALSAMVKQKRITRNEAFTAFDKTGMIPVRLVQVDVKQALNIALKYNICA